MGDLLRQLDGAAHAIAPAAVTLVFVLVAAVPLGVPLYPQIAPFFALMMVYCWTVSRPELMPAPIVFAIGLLTDVLSGAPLGLDATVLLLCWAMVSRQRRYLAGRSFRVLWWGFGVVAAAAALLEWLIASLWTGTPLPPRPALFRALVDIAVFPVVAWLCGQIDRGLLRRAPAP